jgi:hypothetical protein
MQTSVLKPGYLVALKTNVRGGVDYRRVDVEPDHLDDTGARVAKWETSREITDPQEYERAMAARSKARTVITAVCSRSNFGLLCPLAREEDLQQAIADARNIADRHNVTAARTQVEVYVLIGRIAQDDNEAARAIGSEIRGLLDAMTAGIKAADADAIREAASKARSLGQMLSPNVSSAVSSAIKEARTAASEIVKRVAKAGEQAADVVAQCSTQKIEAARFAFLDLDEPTSAEPQAPTARGIDLQPIEA